MFIISIENKLRVLSAYLNSLGLIKEAEDISNLRPDIERLRDDEIEVSKDSEYRNSKDAVKHIQEALINSGFDLPAYGVDGSFGPETERALIQFQDMFASGLSERGVVNSALLNKLEQIASIGSIFRAENTIDLNSIFDNQGVLNAGADNQPSNGEELSINGHILYPFKRNTEVKLVVFYHGIGSGGGQADVLGAVKSLSLNNTMFLIPNGYGVAYSSLSDTIASLQTEHNITITSKSLGGWSKGSIGFMTAHNSNFDQKMLADPSPENEAFGSSLENIPNGVYMEYNVDNWSSKYPGLARRLPQLADKIRENGGIAEESGGTHSGILTSVLRKISQ